MLLVAAALASYAIIENMRKWGRFKNDVNKEVRMKKYLIAILSVLTLAVFTSGAFAAEAGKAESAEPKNPCATKKNCGLEGISKVTGTFKSIDRKKGELVLTGEDGKDTTFKIKSIKAKHVKPGDKVEVTCVKKGDECFAKKLKKMEESRGKEL